MFTFKDLINNVDFESIWKEYLVFYPDMSYLRDNYLKIYNFLLSKETEKNIKEMVIHIDRQDYEELLEKVDCQLDLNENEFEDIGYRVHGKNNSIEWNGYWDISGSKWGDWLGYYIHDKVIKLLTNEQIVALCLYEMTFHGFSENHVPEWANKLGSNLE